MQTSYPISKTQFQIIVAKERKIVAAKAELDATYAVILAQHDVTAGSVVGVTETAITIETPDVAPADAGEGAEA